MLAASPVTHATPHALVPAGRADTDALGETIAALAARLHAATYELLVLLHEFDERTGWDNGCLSCAHWLHWRTGIDLGAAREKVRVASALPTLPRISAAMQCGRISYAKVRALTRVATSDNEAALLDLALAGNCTHVERVVRAWRRVDRVQAAQEAETKHLQRQLSTWVDDDGMVVIRGRLTPEVGAVVQRALEAAADRLFRETAHALTGDAITEDLTPAQRRADALGLLAESAMAAGLDGGTAGDRCQVVLHVTTSEAGDRTAESGVHQAAPAAVARERHGIRRVRRRPRSGSRCGVRFHGNVGSSGVRRVAGVHAPRRRRRRARREPQDAYDPHRRFAAPWRRATPVAAFRAARPAGATRTTSNTGPTAAPRASTTSCCSAAVITARSTKADSASSAGARACLPS